MSQLLNGAQDRLTDPVHDTTHSTLIDAASNVADCSCPSPGLPDYAILGIILASFLGLFMVCVVLLASFHGWLDAKYGRQGKSMSTSSSKNLGVQEEKEGNAKSGPQAGGTSHSLELGAATSTSEAQQQQLTLINATGANEMSQMDDLVELQRKLRERRGRLLELERLDKEEEYLHERMRQVGILPGKGPSQV